MEIIMTQEEEEEGLILCDYYLRELLHIHIYTRLLVL